VTDILAQIEGHLNVWQLEDVENRTAEISRVYTDKIEIVEPDGVIRGRAELNRRIGQLQDHFGGLSFAVSGPPIAHNGYALYRWQQHDARDGSHTADGWDVLHFKGDRIDRVVMFISGFESLNVPKRS
jgi:hypothetical protein